MRYDTLQVGFQSGSSTTTCSWAATAIIDHYIQQCSEVFACAMDLSKAFEVVEWLELFKILRKGKVKPVFLRLLLLVYANQGCQVRWNGKDSYMFPVTNGVR